MTETVSGLDCAGFDLSKTHKSRAGLTGNQFRERKIGEAWSWQLPVPSGSCLLYPLHNLRIV